MVIWTKTLSVKTTANNRGYQMVVGFEATTSTLPSQDSHKGIVAGILPEW